MTGIEVKPTRPDHPQVAALLATLDAYLYQQYPVAEFPSDVNHILSVTELLHPRVAFMAAWQGGQLVGCGAMRPMPNDGLNQKSDAYGEIKRMVVRPEARGQRVGEHIVIALEAAAKAQNLPWMRLESGSRQPEALRLYARCGYTPCGRFGDYAPNPVSVFMEKRL